MAMAPPSGLWRGRYIAALGFSRTVYFDLTFKGNEVNGTYFVTLFQKGERASGSVYGTLGEGKMSLTAGPAASATASMPSQDPLTVDLTYSEGPPQALYGVVTGAGNNARYSGVIRMRPVSAPFIETANGGGWIDSSIEQE